MQIASISQATYKICTYIYTLLELLSFQKCPKLMLIQTQEEEKDKSELFQSSISSKLITVMLNTFVKQNWVKLGIGWQILVTSAKE